MHSQAESYERFLALHTAPGAFVMPNAWDGASAALLKRAGFQALGSTSLAIAFSLGVHDGAAMVDRDTALANAQLLHRASGLPVNGDLEDGFGPSPDDCVRTVEAAIARGLAGLGIEDTTADPDHPIHDFDHAVARIRAAARAARGRIVLTARTDNFLQGRPDLDDTIRRLTAFAEAGADVLYAPWLPSLDAIEQVVRAVSPRPVNVLIGPADGPVPLAQLEQLGVKRISTGGALYLRAMKDLVSAAEGLQRGDLSAATGGIRSADVAALLDPADGQGS
ncbi:MAG TPA: isocitrate lyase/phosphoenolpyruvate mutase family protein [Longimicrobium sp.]|nr:isocitrate lyase/phosphoenolpyruvate mutase family protein [Longimicrobium sp.]